ncbi:hypothetical protein VITU9109_03695 [Vibrio tubiashii ATCC 19109]|uniref:Uncharacterized protein n=1 Tax=Vibrio tubiashii ATCC 19109 TaxID=1051646 RepID=A0ABP2LLD0_9VIBR|nr:hypothetical protein VITU9109_03695 [Vibrio tubiashii ATCC 19109]
MTLPMVAGYRERDTPECRWRNGPLNQLVQGGSAEITVGFSVQAELAQ